MAKKKSKPAPVPEKGVTVLTVVSPEVALEMDRVCGGKGRGGRRAKSGRSFWLLGLIHNALKFPPPAPPAGQEENKVDVRHIDTSRLDQKTRVVVELYKKGMSLQDIVDFLEVEKVPTIRGGPWDARRVKTMLESASNRASAEIAKAKGIPQERRTRGYAVKD